MVIQSRLIAYSEAELTKLQSQSQTGQAYNFRRLASVRGSRSHQRLWVNRNAIPRTRQPPLPSAPARQGETFQPKGPGAKRTGRLSSGHNAFPESRSIRAQCPVEFDVAVRYGQQRFRAVLPTSPTSALRTFTLDYPKLQASRCLQRLLQFRIQFSPDCRYSFVSKLPEQV
jgi:hypothetical protein